MPKLLCFTDLHAHPFRAYAQVLPGGMNSRLADALHCIQQVREEAVKRDVDLVLFGGDMFHVRKNIPVQAYNAVYDEVAKFAEHQIPVVAIHGNHDQADRTGADHSIYGLRSLLTVVDHAGWVIQWGRSKKRYNVLAVPYTEDVDHLRSVVAKPAPVKGAPRILLGHLGIQGAKVGADFVYANEADPTVDDLGMGEFDAGFLGHYHMHQELAPRLWYVGAPLQHNWGDAGQVRGFVVYDTDTGEMEHVELRAPKFVHYTEGHAMREMLTGNVVRVHAEREWSPEEKDAFANKFALLGLEVVVPDEPAAVAGPRLVIDPSMARTDTLRAYVESGLAPTGALEEEHLLRVGAELLQEVSDG